MTRRNVNAAGALVLGDEVAKHDLAIRAPATDGGKRRPQVQHRSKRPM